jgi:integrase/recombinase XerD
MQTTFSTTFIPRSSREIDGLVPIYCRVTVNGTRAEFSIKRSIPLSSWAVGKVKGNNEESRSLNSYLKQIEARIFEQYRELILQKKPFKAEDIRNAYLGIKPDEHSLISLIKYHNIDLKATLEWGTMKNYETTQKYIQAFLKSKRMNDILLGQLSYKFVVDFELFLRAFKPVDHHLPMGNNTVMKHIERLKKMVNVAIKNEWLEKDPFAKFQAKFIRKDRGFLSDKELKAIERLKLEVPRLELIRDLFVFSCYTGLPYSEVMQLTPQNIELQTGKIHWIRMSRKKTNQPVRVPLLPIPLKIIQKYKSNPRAVATGCVFPKISNQKLNAYLKEIADLTSIKKILTFHLARHTFATTVTLANGVPIESVSKMLAHTSIRTTQIYARVIEQKVGQDMNMLRKQLVSTHRPQGRRGSKKRGPRLSKSNETR